MSVPLSWYLVLSAALFCVGLFGVLARRSAIGVLMGVELMLNSVIINMLAFWRFSYNQHFNGMVFAAIIFIAAAAEASVGLALIVSEYRRRRTIIVDDMNLLKG